MTSNSTSAAGRAQLLDRPPNRWYQSGFLAPTETSLSERAVDPADVDVTEAETLHPLIRAQILEQALAL